MYCNYCGSMLREKPETRFCIVCGDPIDVGDSETHCVKCIAKFEGGGNGPRNTK